MNLKVLKNLGLYASWKNCVKSSNLIEVFQKLKQSKFYMN
jgi:hypothetical protein